MQCPIPKLGHRSLLANILQYVLQDGRIPVLLYGAEACILLSTYKAALKAFKRKVLRKILGPVWVGDDFRMQYNSELHELLNDMDVAQRLHCLSHVVRRSHGGGCSGETGIWREYLRKLLKRTTLYPLEGPSRGTPVIDWCDQLAKADKKQRRLEGFVAAGRNVFIGLLWPFK